VAFFNYSHYYQFPAGQRGGAGGAGSAAGGNNAFGRPNNTQATPFFAGGNGVIMPINPAGANPLGGGLFGINQPLAPAMVVMPRTDATGNNRGICDSMGIREMTRLLE